MPDLFDILRPHMETYAEGVILLRGIACCETVFEHLQAIRAQAPFRHQVTPGGRMIRVATTNCGALGWTSGPAGYAYRPDDPETGLPWPPIPTALKDIAVKAAAKAGFPGYEPNACLINRYRPGLKLGSHQDKNERDFHWPVVTLSIGVPAVFQLYGPRRSGNALNIPLENGDVLVMGGPARLSYHGVKALLRAHHRLTGDNRYSFTFRRA